MTATLHDLAHARLLRDVGATLAQPLRSGPAISLSAESDRVVVLVDRRAELTGPQALDVARDLRALALDVGAVDAGQPAAMSGAEARARLRLIAEVLDGIDRGEKRVSDLVWVCREMGRALK